MEIHELVIDMKLLERRLTLYEEKYGVLSDDFYAALMSGELADYGAYDETRSDFSRWKGICETLQRRKAAYHKQLEGQKLANVLRIQPAYRFSSEKAPLFTGEMNRFVDLPEFVDSDTMSTR